ncbi:hypothetical protein PIB30_094168, partial [Stylosanthes scabra]|nr:hypothetical protein [Stylosanthes scabra]
MSLTWPERDIHQGKGNKQSSPATHLSHVWPMSESLDHVLTWAKRSSTMNKVSLANPPYITFGPHFLPTPNVTQPPHHTKAMFESHLAKPKREAGHTPQALTSQHSRPCS